MRCDAMRAPPCCARSRAARRPRRRPPSCSGCRPTSPAKRGRHGDIRVIIAAAGCCGSSGAPLLEGEVGCARVDLRGAREERERYATDAPAALHSISSRWSVSSLAARVGRLACRHAARAIGPSGQCGASETCRDHSAAHSHGGDQGGAALGGVGTPHGIA